jgi:hypothetical protein
MNFVLSSRRCKSINKKFKVLALVVIVAMAAVASLLIASQLAVGKNATASVAQDVQSPQSSPITANSTVNNGTFGFSGPMMFGGFGGMRIGIGGMRQFGSFGQIQVSTEFTQNVTNVLNNSTDVKNLLNQGYNVTSIRPVITTTVNGNGYLVTQATRAEVVLQGTNGRAFVTVDLSQQKVTKIVTTTINENPT